MIASPKEPAGMVTLTCPPTMQSAFVVFWDMESYAAMGSSCGGVGMAIPLYISSQVLPRIERATLR